MKYRIQIKSSQTTLCPDANPGEFILISSGGPAIALGRELICFVLKSKGKKTPEYALLANERCPHMYIELTLFIKGINRVVKYKAASLSQMEAVKVLFEIGTTARLRTVFRQAPKYAWHEIEVTPLMLSVPL